jgi:hypothetical protein
LVVVVAAFVIRGFSWFRDAAEISANTFRRSLYAHIMSQKVMKKVVVSIWNDFEHHRWDHLVESMPERIQVVIKARGGSTRF